MPMPSVYVTVCALVGLVCTACGGVQRSNQARSRSASVDIESAGMPWRVVGARDGRELSKSVFYERLAEVDAVCIGETHDNPHHHWAQLQIVRHLVSLASVARTQLALGMEMFQRPFQGVLDDYAAGHIDERTMLARTGWAKRWGHDYALYRPIVAAVLGKRLSIVALNVSTELKKRVSSSGIDGLTAEERQRLPELQLKDAEHRAWFDAVMASMMGGHGKGHSHGSKHSTDGIYTIQVLWDETMADTAARWLSAGARRQIVILAGSGHCHDSAIVRRLLRRGVKTALSVHPVLATKGASLDDLLADSRHDFLFVMTP